MADSNLRLRNAKGKGKSSRPESEGEEVLQKTHKYTSTYASRTDAQGTAGKIALAAVTALAFFTRFYKLYHPNEVVFDEVHFGKFASYYIQRLYFFDVHPPMAKILFAFMGWLVGYDGHFLFDNIGDSYIENKVPYIGLRTLPATLGALTVVVTFCIMRDSGYSLAACLVATALVLFDNGQLGEQRLILLDATLIFSVAMSIWMYILFYRYRHQPFTKPWWTWLTATGIALSFVMSTKYVGLFTFITIGSAVAIDLWNLLDINRGLPMREFTRHFIARAATLIVLPFIIYLFWFWLHFAILIRSGPGDEFMTPQFQATLSDNPMTTLARDIHYYDVITIMHKDTKAYLHSHTARYPLRYDDGRVSSQGQQVTAYPFNDTNNNWMVLPPYEEEVRQDRPVKHKDVIKLRHIGTNTDLLTHDVASPYYPTNEEFTTVPLEESMGKRFNDTLFTVEIENAKDSAIWRTRAGLFKLVHVPTRVAMWTHTKPLPDWGFRQQEVNGNKNLLQSSNIWYVEDIIGLQDEESRKSSTPKKIVKMAFLSKYLELQRAMFYHNNALTSSHPYASQPISWPFLLRGVSFWTKADPIREQIYFLGNPIGWWIAVGFLSVFTGILSADQLTRRRGLETIDEPVRFRLYNSTGYFFLAWAAHYFPFFLMGRQLFLHHYLPAHFCSCLVTGALIQFLFSRGFDGPVSPGVVVPATKSGKVSPATKGPVVETTERDQLAERGVAAAIIVAVLVGFLWFAPLTYGTPGCSVEKLQSMKWLDTWDFHFLK